MIATSLKQIASDIDMSCTDAMANICVRGVCTDSRRVAPGDLFVAIEGEHFDGHDFVEQALASGAAACLVDERFKGSAGPTLKVADPVNALGRMAAAHRRRTSATVIAVTGSNGKTTTKGMIDQVLGRFLRGRAAAKSFNNHLGVPLTLLSAEKDDDYLVVEIGSSNPGEVAKLGQMSRPDIAVITSIGWAHLEGLGDLDGVVQEKTSLLKHVAPGGWALVNTNEPRMRAWLKRWPGDVALTTFGFGADADLRVRVVEADAGGMRFCVGDGPVLRIPLPGRHNASNAAATLAVCSHLGLAEDEVAAGLANIEPPDMRLNVSEHGSYRVINDSYNANPSSMAAAIEVLGGAVERPRILVAGDMLELGEQAGKLHRHIGEQAARQGIEVIVGVGAHAEQITEGVKAMRAAGRRLVFRDAGEAAAHAAEWLEPGAVVLVKGSRSMGMERVARAVAEAARCDEKMGASV
ncbi:MAG: UDP-N-acetylmuramoyl-tripeptide--D-alanyl-D-alanine ligase [Phycisphaerae bacterium]